MLNHSKYNFILFGVIALVLLFGCKPKKAFITSEESDQTDQAEPSPDPAHNSKNSVDWSGVYQGYLPCDDCSNEIKTTLKLEENGAFDLDMKHPDKNEGQQSKHGHFKWNNKGSAVTLWDEHQKEILHYKVGENVLFLLDEEGEPLSMDFDFSLNLKKQID